MMAPVPRASAPEADAQPPQPDGGAAAAVAAPVASGCVACGLSAEAGAFASQAEQREHFRSDWHRINVKRRHGGRPPLTEQQFEQLISRDEDVSAAACSVKHPPELGALLRAAQLQLWRRRMTLACGLCKPEFPCSTPWHTIQPVSNCFTWQ